MKHEFAKRLKSAREALRLTQAEVGDRAGFSPAEVSFYETGTRTPTIENLARLCKALKVSADWLLSLN